MRRKLLHANESGVSPKIEVPRARLNTPDGKTTEWKSKALRAYQRLRAARRQKKFQV